MGFYIVNGIGDSEDDPSLAVMRRFIEALDPEDREHGAAWVCDEAHNVLHYDVSGNLHYARKVPRTVTRNWSPSNVRLPPFDD